MKLGSFTWFWVCYIDRICFKFALRVTYSSKMMTSSKDGEPPATCNA